MIKKIVLTWITLISLLFLVGLCFPSHEPSSQNPYDICYIDSYEIQLFCNSSRYREKNGLKPLYFDTSAYDIAVRRAKHLCETDTFSHDGWKEYIELEYSKAGENLARGFDYHQDALKSLIESKAHRDNILGDFTSGAVHTEPCGGKNVSVQILFKR